MAKRKLTLADFEGPNSLNMPSDTNTRGIADPEALRALGWNEDYDVDARRNAIAAALLAKQVAAPGAAAAPGFDQLTAMPNDYRFGGSGDYGMAGGQQAGDASSVAIGPLFSGGVPGFREGAPPGKSMFGPEDSGSRTPAPTPSSRGGRDSSEEDATVADIMDQVAQANAIAQAMSTATPTPSAPAPGGRESVTQSNMPEVGRTPAAYGDPFTPGGVPPSGNLFEGQGFISPTGATPAPAGGYAGQHSDIPGATPSAPAPDTTTAPAATGWGGAMGIPGAGFAAAGWGETGFNAAPDTALSSTGGAILGDASKGWGDMAVTPSGSFATGQPDFSGSATGGKGGPGKGGSEGAMQAQEDADTAADRNALSESDVDQALADLGASMQAANAVAQAMPGAPTPDPSDFDVGRGPFDPGGPGYSPGQALTTGTSMVSPGTPGRGGFVGSSLADMVADMTAQGMPSPGGSFSSGWGSTLADLGDLGAPGAVDTAGLTDTGPMGGGGMDFGGSATGAIGGPGSGMSEGAAAAASEAGAASAAAAAGGSAGFGGMGAGGGVGPGGMSTGGTGEVGSVADPGGFGPGGFSGNAASEAGGFGGFGSGGFDPGGGDTTGAGDTSGNGGED